MKRIFTPLGLGIAVPVVTLVVLALSIYLPGFFVKPTHDFVYTINSYSYSQGNYSASDGKIIFTEYPKPTYEGAPTITPEPGKPKLYRYYIDTDTSDEITLEAANAFSLSTSTKSPDGFTYGYGYGGTMFGIGGRPYEDNNPGAIEGKGVRHELKIDAGSTYRVMFLAWIK